MTEIICTTITAIATIIVAIVGIEIKKQNREAENHFKLRREESMLLLHMVDATLQLSVVTSNALTGGHNNGNVERAKAAAKQAAEDYREFTRRTAIYEVCR